MFFFALIAFSVFVLLYVAFSAVVLYHLNRYAPPIRSIHSYLIAIFYLLASASLVLMGIFSLALIPH